LQYPNLGTPRAPQGPRPKARSQLLAQGVLQGTRVHVAATIEALTIRQPGGERVKNGALAML